MSPVFVLKRPGSSKATSVGESCGPSILVKADISGAERRAVVDTGSGVNLMSKEIAEQYPVPLQKYDGTVYHAEGKQIRLLGKKTLPFCMGGKFVCDAGFLVAPMLPVNIILGTAFLKPNQCSIDFHTGRLFTGTTESSAVAFDCVFKTEEIANNIDHGPSEMSGFEGGFLTARCLNAIEIAPYGRLSVEIEISESGVNLSQGNFLVSETNWPKKSLLAIPEIYSCDGGGHGKIVIENHAETRVKIEAGALIAKVRKTAWPKNREELEDTNWLFEQFYEIESTTPNRFAFENRDYVSEQRRRMPMVQLMPNSPETENNLVENDNALGLRFKLFGKRSGAVFHCDKGSNTRYYINPWFQQGEKVLYTDLWRLFSNLRTKAERYHTLELRIDEKDLKLLGLNMEIVHDFIIRIFGVSEVRFLIIPDQSSEEILKEDSIKGAPRVLSTISEDAQFNADVDEITEALLENTNGANNQQKDVAEQIVYNFRANFAKDDNELVLTNLVEHNIETSDRANQATGLQDHPG